MRPALTDVPEGDWFCHACEGQLGTCRLGQEAATACVSLLLCSQEGRELLRDHAPHAALLQALQLQALKQV